MRLFAPRGTISCRDAVELITSYLDGGLSERERRRLERHLSTCPHCTEYLRQLRLTIEATGHVEADELSPHTQATLIEIYRSTRPTES